MIKKMMMSAAFISAATALASPAYGAFEKTKVTDKGTPIKYGARVEKMFSASDALTRSNTDDQQKLQRLEVVFFELTSDLIAQIEQQGIQVLVSSEKYSRAVLGVSSKSQLDFINQLVGIQHIYEPGKRYARAGRVDNEAVQALNISRLQAAPFNLDGEGITIGVISDSLARTSDVRDSDTSPAICQSGILTNSKPQKSGDLPASIRILADSATLVPDTCDSSVVDEGAAMAELIHDIAPKADIIFHTAGNSTLEFALAIDRLCVLSDIVVDDIAFLNQLRYQDDIVAQAAAGCVAMGKHYFTAVGNDGDSGYQFNYQNVQSSDVGNVELHRWSNGEEVLGITLDPGENITVLMHWNQPAVSASNDRNNAPQIDLDLYLYQQATVASTILAGSDEEQNGSENSADPVEILSYQNASGTTKTVYLSVEHWSGNKTTIPQNSQTPLEFSLVIFGGDQVDVSIPYNSTTVFGHVNALGVNSVAAVPWFDTAAFDPALPPTAAVDPESFTSRGGLITKQFDTQGNFATTQVFTPSFAAVDASNTTFFGESIDLNGEFGEPDGNPNFFGTSAAAPNAAAAAALILQANKAALQPSALTALLTGTAIDITGERAAPGRDNVTGYGLIDVQSAVESLADDDTNPDDNSDGGSNDNSDSGQGDTADDSLFNEGGSGGGSGGGGVFSLWFTLLLTLTSVGHRYTRRLH